MLDASIANIYNNASGRGGGMVDAADLKSAGAILVGSNPAPGTKIRICLRTGRMVDTSGAGNARSALLISSSLLYEQPAQSLQRSDYTFAKVQQACLIWHRCP